MPEQTFERRPADQIRLHPENTRIGDLEELVDSIRTLGWFGVLGVQASTGYALWGNHRFQAGQIARGRIADGDPDWAGWTDRHDLSELEAPPCMVLDVDDEEALDILLRDNVASDRATWDRAGLATLLADIEARRGSFESTGFRRDDYDLLTRELGDERRRIEETPDVAPAPADPFITPGDCWHLGPHRLVCGDARHDDTYRHFGIAHLLVTDPPYGVAIGAKNRTLAELGHAGANTADLEGDTSAADAEALWQEAFPTILAQLPPGAPYYVFGTGGPLGARQTLALEDAGYEPRHTLVWVKDRASFSLGRLDYDYQHEIVLYGWKDGQHEARKAALVDGELTWVDYDDGHDDIVYGWKAGAAHPWYSLDTQTTVLHFDRPAASPEHPTMKPVDLLEHLIRNSSRRGDTVLDPFAGSGSTLIAAEQAGRRALLVEKHPGFCDVIARRWQALTGELPTLAGGRSYDFIERPQA